MSSQLNKSILTLFRLFMQNDQETTTEDTQSEQSMADEEETVAENIPETMELQTFPIEGKLTIQGFH